MEKIITLSSGHIMYLEAYTKKLEYFGECLKQAGINIIEMCRPHFGYDYTYLVNAKEAIIPDNTMEKFARAGLKTFIDIVSSTTNDNKVDKTFIIRFKY
jgi:hypothetical protein